MSNILTGLLNQMGIKFVNHNYDESVELTFFLCDLFGEALSGLIFIFRKFTEQKHRSALIPLGQDSL